MWGGGRKSTHARGHLSQHGYLPRSRVEAVLRAWLTLSLMACRLASRPPRSRVRSSGLTSLSPRVLTLDLSLFALAYNDKSFVLAHSLPTALCVPSSRAVGGLSLLFFIYCRRGESFMQPSAPVRSGHSASPSIAHSPFRTARPHARAVSSCPLCFFSLQPAGSPRRRAGDIFRVLPRTDSRCGGIISSRSVALRPDVGLRHASRARRSNGTRFLACQLPGLAPTGDPPPVMGRPGRLAAQRR